MAGQRHKAGIIGYGGMGVRHYAAYQKAGVDVVAICDRDKTKCATAASEHPGVQVYTDYARLYQAEKDNIDIVSIVTNSPSHASATIQAAKAGIKNILCEKPMATNLADARRMIEACKESGSRLAINYVRRWSPNHHKLKQLLDQGVIGQLRHIYIHSGSTGLGNVGSVFFDNMRFYADSEVDWVIGFIDQTGTPSPRGRQFIDPAGYGMVHFQNGVRAFLDTSEDTGVQYICELVGTHGRVVIDELSDEWRIRSRTNEDRSKPLTLYVLPMPAVPFELETRWDVVELTSKAQTALLSSETVACDGEQGFRALEIVMAFHVSERLDHRAVRLPLDAEALTLDFPFA